MVTPLLLLTVWALIGPLENDEPRPAAYELVWEAPGSCPDGAAIRAQIAALAPNPAGGEGTIFVRGQVTAIHSGFSLEISTEFAGQVDTRTVDTAVCDELGEVAALVVAVALEPGLATESVATDDEPASPERGSMIPESPALVRSASAAPGEAVPHVGAAQPISPPVAEANRAYARPDRVYARMGPKVEWGALPRVDIGIDLTVGAAWTHWRAEVSGMYLVPERVSTSGSAALYQVGAAALRGCRRLLAGRMEFPVCLGLEGGAMRVDSRQLDPQNTLWFGWLAPLAMGGVAFAGERVGFFAAGEVAIPVLLARVLIGEDRAFETRPVSVRGVIGLEVFLGRSLSQ